MATVLLAPEKLERLRSYVLRTRRRVTGTLTGIHPSPHYGASIEFREHKTYSPGDDLRYLDWKLLAKTDKHYVKQFEKETNLRAYFLVDASGSMDFGTAGATKFECAATLASALSFLLLNQGDAAGVAAFREGSRSVVLPRARSGQLRILHELLSAVRPQGGTGLLPTLQELLPRIHRRSLVVLISDFLDLTPEDLDRALAMMRQVRAESAVFHVIDPVERSLSFKGRTEFVGPETAARVLAYPEAIRARYREAFARFVADVKAACLANGVEHAELSTDEPVDRFLFRYLEQRAVHQGVTASR
ncbi:MAG: DUF58 domain-containing protein [Nitrospirae bacterium]|nr:DUF58 domain-containing protein [Nitrospirota bacterium]